MKYPAIEKYMNNKGIKLAEFAKMCGIPQPTMWRFMHGKADINKSNIDKILRVTGMTYENAFCEIVKGDWKQHFENRFRKIE